MPSEASIKKYHSHDWHTNVKRDPTKHSLPLRGVKAPKSSDEPTAEIVSVRHLRPTMPLPNGLTGGIPETKKKAGKSSRK